MILFNRKLDYSLLVLCYLDHHPEGASAREISAHYELSRAFVANILKELCQKNLVISHRGVKGGYLLKAGTRELSLLALIDLLEDHFRLAECNDAPPDECCKILATCPIREPLSVVHEKLRSLLSEVPLSDLFRARAKPAIPLEVSRCEQLS